MSFKPYIECPEIWERLLKYTLSYFSNKMHCRRYFAEAFFVQDVTSLSDDELLALKETEALLLIRDIYGGKPAEGIKC